MSKTNNPKEMTQLLRNTFNSGKTKPIKYRVNQLKALKRMYEENRPEMLEVLRKDLSKSTQEAVVMEIDFLINDVKNCLMNIHDWVKPERPEKDFANLLDSVYVYREPYGVVLVLGAWNYPLQLTLLPVAGAIAAGNCVLIKPSELSTHTAKFIASIIPKYLDNEAVQVFLGGVPETTDLLKEKFDYIFFTGSSVTGKIVHAAANKHLTPTTLELGGKSPVYIDNSANMEIAIRRILWGKFCNAGQTCVAPDYILCTSDVQENLIASAKKAITEFYGSDPKESPDFCRIINERHFERLVGLLKGNNVAIGGQYNAEDKYISPTILRDVDTNNGIMKEEIFGPILPIIVISNPMEALDFVNQREKPLSLYIFSNNKKDIDLFLNNTSSGGVCVNDVIMHLACDSLPFGGVGSSGMGSYHGKYSFDTFTHNKSVLYKDLGIIGEKLGCARYPPYSNAKISYLQFMLAKRSGVPMRYVKYLLIFCLGYAVSHYYGRYLGL